jgi:putative membrane protein
MTEAGQETKEAAPGAGDRSAVLRDRLATDRTIQANERTLLAYVRTALTMFVAGLSFIRFFGRDLYTIIGTAFIPLSIVILLIGVWRYRHMQKMMAAMARANGIPLQPPVNGD